jgi:hypothetical protein
VKKIAQVNREAELEKKFSEPSAARLDKNFDGYQKKVYARARAGDPRYFCGANGWQLKERFGTLPKWMRPFAEREFARLIEQTKARGQEITWRKRISLMANATAIARDYRCTKDGPKRMWVFYTQKVAYEKRREKRVNVMAERLSAMQDAGMERGDG